MNIGATTMREESNIPDSYTSASEYIGVAHVQAVRLIWDSNFNQFFNHLQVIQSRKNAPSYPSYGRKS